MSSDSIVYEIELLCDYPGWWRFNVYIMLVGYDRSDNRTTFNNLIDRVYDVEYGPAERTPPENYDPRRQIKLKGDPCARAEVYLYVVANTFPGSPDIKDSPPFPMTMKVMADGATIEESTYEVNQWGGLTLAAHRVERKTAP